VPIVIVVMGVCMLLYIKSIIITLVGLMFIIFSIGAASIVIKGIFRISYTSNLNSMNFVTAIIVSGDFIIALVDIHR